MGKKLKSLIVVISFILCINYQGQCQEFSKNSLKYGMGPGIYDGSQVTGLGAMLSVGYQRELWKDRLRLNPNLTVGYFSGKYVLDARDQWCNSINLETIIYFDLIHIKAFALTIGAGGVINTTKGLLGTGGDQEDVVQSEYFKESNVGGYFGGGIRINPQKSRVSFEIMPLNFHFGPNYYFEGFAKVGIDVKL